MGLLWDDETHLDREVIIGFHAAAKQLVRALVTDVHFLIVALLLVYMRDLFKDICTILTLTLNEDPVEVSTGSCLWSRGTSVFLVFLII